MPMTGAAGCACLAPRDSISTTPIRRWPNSARSMPRAAAPRRRSKRCSIATTGHSSAPFRSLSSTRRHCDSRAAGGENLGQYGHSKDYRGHFEAGHAWHRARLDRPADCLLPGARQYRRRDAAVAGGQAPARPVRAAPTPKSLLSRLCCASAICSRGDAIKAAKALLATRPIFHKTDAGIRGHICWTFLTLACGCASIWSITAITWLPTLYKQGLELPLRTSLTSGVGDIASIICAVLIDKVGRKPWYSKRSSGQ
jgi:hypothetical protein